MAKQSVKLETLRAKIAGYDGALKALEKLKKDVRAAIKKEQEKAEAKPKPKPKTAKKNVGDSIVSFARRSSRKPATK